MLNQDNYTLPSKDTHRTKHSSLFYTKTYRHYNPLQVGYYEDIEIDEKKLACHFGAKRPKEKVEIAIIAEEIGYNSNNREFRTLLIERPLVCPTSRPQLIRSILGPLTPLRSTSLAFARQRKLERSKQLRHHDDCAKYLECVSNELTTNLEGEVGRLQSNYIILSQYLQDAATRIKQLVEQYIPKFEFKIEQSGIRVSETIRRSIRLAVENHVVHLLHGKLITTIHDLHEKDDEILIEKFKLISNSKVTLCELGAQKIFADFSPDQDLLREFKQLTSLQSPIAIVSALLKLVDSINLALNQSVRLRRLMGTTTIGLSGDKPNQTVSICSDDLIASFVFILAKATPNNLYSLTEYLNTFGWSSCSNDQPAYYVATLELVIQYISNYNASQVA